MSLHPLLHITLFKVKGIGKLAVDWNAVTIVKNSASLVVFGGFALGAFYLARASTAYLLDTAHLGLFLLHRFVSMLLFVLFLSVNVGNIIVSYATLYRSQETTYLLTKPLAHGHLFLIKFLDNFFYSSAALFLMASAVLFGYGSYFHMTWTFYLQTMFLMFVPFMLISACIAVMELLLLMRFATRVGVQKIIGGVVVTYLASLFFYFKMTNPMKLVRLVTQDFSRVNDYLGYLDPPFAKFLPNQWMAESLFWTMKGDTSYAASYTIILTGAAVMLFAAMLLLAKKLFYSSWLTSLELRALSETTSQTSRRFSLTKPSLIDSATSVMLKKEFWQFIREPSQWIHLGIIAVLIFTFIVSVVQIDMKFKLPFLQTVSFLVIFLFNAFLIGSIALRFVYPMFSIEGRSFWAVLSAPISRAKVYTIKFFIAYLPLTILSTLLIFFSHQPLKQFPAVQTISVILMVSVSLSLVSLNLGAGAFFVNYEEKNPIRAASSQSATLTFLISILYLTLLVGVMFIPFTKYFEYILHGTAFDIMSLYSSVLSVIIISLMIGSVSCITGIQSLKRDF